MTKKAPFFFLLSLILISCNSFQNEKKINTKNTHTYYNGKEANWKFFFPDTVIQGKKYNGKIVYKSDLDTITTSFDDKFNRYFQAILMTSEKPELDFETIQRTAIDTFGSADYPNILFYDIQFSKLGDNYIHGFVLDHIFLEAKNARPEDSLVRMIEKKTSLWHKVYVKK